MKEPKKQGDLLWKPCPRLIEGTGGQGGLCPAVFLHRSDTPDPIISPLSCLPSILLPISHGAVLDHMFYPLSPATRPYYINLLSFPVTCSLPVNSPFPILGQPLPNLSSTLPSCPRLEDRQDAKPRFASKDPIGLFPMKTLSDTSIPLCQFPTEFFGLTELIRSPLLPLASHFQLFLPYFLVSREDWVPSRKGNGA